MNSSHLASNNYNITILPTTCLLNKNEVYITRRAGFINAEEYVEKLKYAR